MPLGSGWEERDVRRGWKWLSLNFAVSENIRACNIGVYARRSFGEEAGMKERVRRRHAYDLLEGALEGHWRGIGRDMVHILTDQP